MFRYFTLLSVLLLLNSCGNTSQKKDLTSVVETPNETAILEEVDALHSLLESRTSGYNSVAVLDHHRMANELGVYTPPAIASIFSDPKTNSELLNINQRIGLDLPFKVLCYANADTSNAQVSYTSADFVMRRHGLQHSQVEAYSQQMLKIIKGVPSQNLALELQKEVIPDYGIVNIFSDYGFQETIGKLKDIINAQNDTRWFGEIDFQNEATPFEINLRPTTILLFGGPGPGGKAMVTTPRIGLDAFCQKLLIYEDEDGKVQVLFNDIVAFSELYYGQSTKPQQMINQRLIQTFTSAIKLK